MHGGISISNFTAGRRRENNSVAFGKAAVGNELLGNAFFPGAMPSAVTKRQAGSETCVSGYTQASLSRPARLASLAMRQCRRLHDGEVLHILGTHGMLLQKLNDVLLVPCADYGKDFFLRVVLHDILQACCHNPVALGDENAVE